MGGWPGIATIGRGLLGAWLVHLSLSLVLRSSSRLLVLLGLVEALAALLFIPRRTCRWGGALLLLVLAFAAGFHLRAGESAALLWGYAAGVLALLSTTVERSVWTTWPVAAGTHKICRADHKFLRAFEATRIAPAEFHHREHIRAAWAVLCHYPLEEALRRYRAALQRVAARAGKPGIYHETITWAYLLLIHERLTAQSSGGGGDSLQFTEFAARNPDLLTWRPSILDAYYSKEVLSSERARQSFVLPGGPAAASAAR